ncbi:MAG: thioesterase family protein [Lautropia sp.]
MTAHHAGPRRSAAEQARLDAAIKQLFEEAITFNVTLGVEVLDCSPGAARLRIPMQPAFVGHFLYGRLHGGVISATLDNAGALGLMCALGEKFNDETSEQIMARFSRMGTIDLRVDYLRPGLGAHFIASASVTRLGGRVGSTQMALHNDAGLLIATAAGAYVVA